MTITLAIILFTLFLFLSGIHFYWVLGGKWGIGAVFPTQPNDTNPKVPGAVPTIIVGIALFTISLFYLIRVKIYPLELPEFLNTYGLKLITGLFVLRAIGEFNYIGFFKKHKETRFGINDTKYYSPLCLLIALLTFILNLNL
ncbi:DUF3995 domain-containing protein [Flavobacterium sp. NG2]|uniref:DUF3995 domain-containing protein n=1 Tax=Flavobacterium sp. NG2 TaxID=3097547 RepID=UPI002A81392E|nr:DUF3995 domain-containing protein [Flavobacterium sp. NG2]WPR71255.1 DUF3995 domain-containing protein [Flavobacterium sp. NG2]